MKGAQGNLGVPLARLVQSVTSITLANNTVKNVDFTVPAGKRWTLKSIWLSNPDDVARDMHMIKYKEAGTTNRIKTYVNNEEVLASQNLQYPSLAPSGEEEYAPYHHDDVYDEGNTLRVKFDAGGASAGGTDANGLVVEYLEVDV